MREVAALILLTCAVLFSFRDAILYGLVAFEKDTLVFFYPLEAWFAEEFKAGRFPLWNPYIFAGYPAFADGEIGLMYPLHLVMLRFLSVEQTFIWLRISSVLIAACSAYALCRALGLGRLPGVLAGVTFSLGSFFLVQQHHENVTRTAAWLPLVLALTEWALHRPGWWRHLFLTGAGMALAMSALGLHPQVLGMTLLGFSTFVIFRVLVGPVGARPGEAAQRGVWGAARRIALMAWIGLYVVVLGLGLASVQLVPLAELGLATYRGSAPHYFFATSYALPMHNLINLILPYFFRGPDSEYWSLWARWETTLYVGIAPLVLGLFGALFARRREAIYFGLLAVLALWLAFASYAPFDLYALLWQLPGVSAFRVPGRYTYLFVLGASVLAAFGLQALSAVGASDDRLRRLLALGVLCVLALGSVALIVSANGVRATLLADPVAGTSWIERDYLSQRHHPGGIEPGDAYRGLVHALDFANPRTRFGALMVGGTLLLVGGLATGLAVRKRTSWVWRSAIVSLAAVDLLLTGLSFHQKTPVDQLSQRTAAIEFLSGQAGARVYTPGESVPSMEFNKLVPFRIEDLGGYSSVEPRENFAYWTTIHSLHNQLLDIANVRYIVSGVRSLALPSYRTVPFDPERPLMLGSRGSIGGVESYSLGGEVGHRVQIVAGLTRALEILQNDVVLEITVFPRSGEPAVRSLRAGVHVAEWAYDRPDIVGKVRHERPPEVAFRRPDTFALDGSRYELYFFYSELDLPQAMEVERIELRYVHERGGIEVYGLGLYNFDTRQTAGVRQQMRSKLRPVYQDEQVRIVENLAAFPRAYVVPRARLAPEGSEALSAMLDSPFDPSSEIMLDLESLPVAGGSPAAARAGEDAGGLDRIEQLASGSDRVVFRVTSRDGGYFVNVAHYYTGWVARLDGQTVPLLVANSLFRAVVLPPGEHTIELSYEPIAADLGRQMTLWAVWGGLAVMLGATIAASLERWRQEMRVRRRASHREPAADV